MEMRSKAARKPPKKDKPMSLADVEDDMALLAAVQASNEALGSLR